jgi:uncharacterized protein (TIGR02271 family)
MARLKLDQIHEGMTVYDLNGDKIGGVEKVYRSGAAAGYLRVSTGFLGLGRELYVPAAHIARLDGGDVYLDADKDALGDAGWETTPAGDDAELTREAREGEGTLRLREEELDVRTRRVQAGEVEVGKRVIEEERTLEVPVEREEVYVERRPVDRAGSGDVDFDDDRQTIRVPVMEEEVDVEKRAYVTEEIGVGKRVVQDTKTVSGTVRREEAVINREGDVRIAGGGSSWDEAMPRLRSSWQQRYGATGGTWSSAEPRYRYGWEMANRPEYRGRSWQEAEPELRRDYEARYADSAWEDVKDFVRDAWDTVTGRTARR